MIETRNPQEIVMYRPSIPEGANPFAYHGSDVATLMRIDAQPLNTESLGRLANVTRERFSDANHHLQHAVGVVRDELPLAINAKTMSPLGIFAAGVALQAKNVDVSISPLLPAVGAIVCVGIEFATSRGKETNAAAQILQYVGASVVGFVAGASIDLGIDSFRSIQSGLSTTNLSLLGVSAASTLACGGLMVGLAKS